MQLKKIIAAGAMGLMMLGSTLAAAVTLADYPAPFVSDGTFNGLIVFGANAKAADVAASVEIAARLGGETTETVPIEGTETTTVSGESVSMASGSNQVYLKDAINVRRSTITDSDLPTILKDGTFTDDNGNSYDYEQTITVDDAPVFEFSNSGGDLDDPALLLQVGDTVTTGTYFYRWKIDFTKAVDFNDAKSKGEKITIAGKEYTIGSSTDSDTLQLLGGADSVYLDTEEGKTATITVSGNEYTVTLKGVTSKPEAVIEVTDSDGNSEAKTIASGGTKTVNGVEVYVDQANYYGLESRLGDATIMVGADELYFEKGSAVMKGSDKDSIDGTLVDWSTDCDSMTTLSIYVAAADNDVDHIGIGDNFVDPVFGTLEFLFTDAPNAPTFAADKGTDTSDRSSIEISRAADRALNIKFKDKNGNEKTQVFYYNAELQDKSGNDIEIVEGTPLIEDEYTILNSGDYQQFIQVTKINIDDDDTADDDVWFKDIFTGTTYKLEDKDLGDAGDTATITISGQTYTVETVSTTSVKIYSSDFPTDTSTSGKKVSVYPYIDLVAGKNHRIAFTDDLAMGDTTRDKIEAQVNDTRVTREYILPTGSLYIGVKDSNVSGAASDGTYEYSTDGTTWTAIGDTTGSAYNSVQVGTVYYLFKATKDETGAKDTLTLSGLAIDRDQDVDVNDAETDPGILFVEDEDNADSDDKNAVILPMTDDTSYSQVEVGNLKFTSPNTYEDVSFDDSDYEGNIDSFGTYVLVDKSDTHQDLATITYPKEQMYGNFYFGEKGIKATTSTSGSTYEKIIPIKEVPVAKLDTEVKSADKINKHLILVGGPCANSLVEELAAKENATVESCADWSTPEGSAIITLVKDAFEKGKYALVVAGTSADGQDTRMAGRVLQRFDDYELTGDSVTVTGTLDAPEIVTG